MTIFYWMLKGKKGRLEIFQSRVSDEDIRGAEEFGETFPTICEKNDWQDLQQQLVKKKAVEVKYSLMFIESKASKIFSIWANIIVEEEEPRTFG